jgi:hypothetical protein
MVDTVKTRRTHYDVLGLKPAATSDEIARAFAKEIGRPRALGGIAEISVAYETLRNPDRRSAYDDSLRPAPPKPEPSRSPTSLWDGSPYLLRASAHPAEPHVDPRPRPETPEPERVSSIGAALRELASSEPLQDMPALTQQPQASNRPDADAEPKADPPPSAERKVHVMLDDGPGDAEEGAVPWKRTAIAAGALVLSVAVLSAWAGSGAGGGSREPKDAVKLALPPSTTFTIADPAAAAPAPAVEDARPSQPKRAVRTVARVVPARPTSRLADLERQISKLPQSEPSAPQAAATGQAADAAPETAVAASMPLPNSVIAHTIQRIGYPCGQVSSTVPGGASGVFTVTCTSGHSYQAAPVRGRYRFRRVAGR